VRTTYSIKGDDYAYFVTSTIVNWIPVFSYSQCTEFLLEALNYSKLRKGLKIYAWVIMPEHFHMMCKSENLVDIIRSIKSYTAKRIIYFLEQSNNEELLNQFRFSKKQYKESSRYQIWQEGFKPKAILSENIYWQKICYIHNNPVKRGLAEIIEEYELSSARDFAYRKPGRLIVDDFDYD